MLFTKKTLLCLGDAAKLYSWSDYLRSKVMLDYQSSVLRSLVCTQNETLLSVFLEKSLNEKSYENEDVVPIVIAIAGNKFGFDLVTEFLSKNIKTIHSR